MGKGGIVIDGNEAHKWILMLVWDNVFSQDCILEQEKCALRCLLCQTMADVGETSGFAFF